ncbi:hypothetical protein DU846_19955 [Salmonella enterica subsp. diarizonae]|nr:hypothetical protein [Salmonella enterica]EBL7408825.1 hypothetical protein [Salmonella enterica]ECI5367287.1 hypothetical protein [Salmonella enterica subsp. diarizonae]
MNNIKGLSKEIFENNTNRDLKPQKDKNTIFYTATHKKDQHTSPFKPKKTDKNTKKHTTDSKKDRILNNSQKRYLFLFL